MLKNRKKIIEGISFPVFILSISPLFIFVSVEGTFLVRSIIPLIALLLIYTVIKRKGFTFTVHGAIKWFLVLQIIYIFSAMINSLFYDAGVDVIIQLIYQIGIFLWFSLILSKKNFSKRELHFYMDMYILTCVVCSMYVIFVNLVRGGYTSSIINLLGYKIGKNFYGALMVFGPIYASLKVLYGKKHKLIYIFSVLIMLVGIVFTNSRGTMLGLGSGMLIVLFQYSKDKITLKRLMITFFIVIAAVLSIRPILRLIPDWMFRRYFTNSYIDSSNTDRLMRWKNAIDGIIHSPIIGYGPGVFSNIPKYQVTDFGTTISDATYAHNTYLDVMVNGGILGLLCFAGGIYKCIKETVKYNKLFIPVIICLLITSGILGAGKSVYFWDNLIFIGMISNYTENNPKDRDVFSITFNHIGGVNGNS